MTASDWLHQIARKEIDDLADRFFGSTDASRVARREHVAPKRRYRCIECGWLHHDDEPGFLLYHYEPTDDGRKRIVIDGHQCPTTYVA